MSESALDLLDGRTRRDVEALASTINVPAEIVISEMVTGYVRLLREAPGALPTLARMLTVHARLDHDP